MTSRTLAKKAAEFALSKKASDVLLMDLRKLSAPADFFVLCSADSDTHVRAIADAVRYGTDEIGVRLWQSEGFTGMTWIILDYVDVVVHVFKKVGKIMIARVPELFGDFKEVDGSLVPEYWKV